MESATLAKLLSVFFISTVKFMWAPGAALVSGFSFGQTILITSIGGMTGITFFYFFGRWAVEKLERVRRRSRGASFPEGKPKIFTKKNRRIVKFKWSFGLIGLVVVTPAILSIPIGCVIAAKFYRHNQFTYPLLLLSTLLWSVGLTVVIYFIKSNIN